MSPTDEADVVVIGGGVIGLSAAWALTEVGGGKVTVLERSTIGEFAAVFRVLPVEANELS